jgi:hypothetical protein
VSGLFSKFYSAAIFYSVKNHLEFAEFYGGAGFEPETTKVPIVPRNEIL